MRPNASIPALLATAALLLLPATLLAKTVHRRAHRTTASHSAGAHHKAASATKVSTPRRHTAPAVERVSTGTSRGRHLHRSHSRRSASAVSIADRDKEKARPRDAEPTATPTAMPVVLYNKRGRLIVPPPLRGSREVLVRQNEVADRYGLDRIQNDADLINMREKGLLVAIPTSTALQVDDRLPVDRRYCRRWTERFLINLARAHYARFHTPLQVNSAVRTVEFQEHLIRINGNAAPAEGDTASPHLTGQAVDLAKHGLSRTEIAWMRGYLLPLVQEGKIDVEEEFKQSCFHISVYKNYLPPDATPRRSIAATHGSEAALATALH